MPGAPPPLRSVSGYEKIWIRHCFVINYVISLSGVSLEFCVFLLRFNYGLGDSLQHTYKIMCSNIANEPTLHQRPNEK